MTTNQQHQRNAAAAIGMGGTGPRFQTRCREDPRHDHVLYDGLPERRFRRRRHAEAGRPVDAPGGGWAPAPADRHRSVVPAHHRDREGLRDRSHGAGEDRGRSSQARYRVLLSLHRRVRRRHRRPVRDRGQARHLRRLPFRRHQRRARRRVCAVCGDQERRRRQPRSPDQAGRPDLGRPAAAGGGDARGISRRAQRHLQQPSWLQLSRRPAGDHIDPVDARRRRAAQQLGRRREPELRSALRRPERRLHQRDADLRQRLTGVRRLQCDRESHLSPHRRRPLRRRARFVPLQHLRL